MRRLGGSLVAAAVVGALLSVATAWAGPQIGRCVKSATPKTGSYSSGSCTKAKSHGNWEWLPGPGSHPGFTIKAMKPIRFEAPPLALTCQHMQGTGEYVGTNGLAAVHLAWAGCVAEGPSFAISCQNTANAGEILSDQLTGSYGVITAGLSAAEDRLGVDISGEGAEQQVTEYICGGPSNRSVGSVIAPVKANKMATKQTLHYEQSAGHQVPEGFEGMAPDVLRRSIGGGAYEQTGEAATITVTSEEPIEINSVL